MYEISDNYKLMLANIKTQLSLYLFGNRQLKTLVIGLSGGIDSALTCVLAREAIKDMPGVVLLGRSLPIETNKQDEISRGEEIGNLFCHDYKTFDLTDAYKALYKHMVPAGRGKKAGPEELFEEKVRQGNIKARIRMIYLFDLAHFNRGMVLSTDNFTELMLGFWTLHGDVGNFGLLQYLWKTEVYGLAQYLEKMYRKNNDIKKADALRKSIDAVPTDGLGITASDFDQIGVADYSTADNILLKYLNGDRQDENHPVVKRYKATRFKRRDPLNITREKVFEI